VTDFDGSFNDASLVEYLRDFTSPEYQKQAIETKEQSERAFAAANDAFQSVILSNMPDRTLDLTPVGLSRDRTEKSQRVHQAHTKLLVRIDRIERARENRLDRIRQKQALDNGRQAGRSLTDEFGRRR
jgi:hypothetical protein